MERHRISTNIGRDQKITVQLSQDFSLLEVLSLKLTQKDVYTSLCSDYGVVCGRVSVNNGLGIPNARLSIFIPLSTDDEDDPVISTLYPYKSVSDRNEDGLRYNLLPSPFRKQHGGHEPTGSFPDQLEILTREEVLEVYEKYYKYTVKTNDAGDFMIWGVPVGTQTLHVDVDLSDMGCFSLRPDDLIRQGAGVDQFKNSYSFKSSTDLSSLPQIVTYDKTIDVYPFWGSEDLCEIGITRTDFDLSDQGVKIEPKSYFIGGLFTDSGKNSVNKNCEPRRKMGRKCDLQTKTGTIEGIRFSNHKDEKNRPILEYYDLHEDVPDDGGFMFSVPMNMDYVYTNEFGDMEVTNDPNKGVPTSGCYRFRFMLDDSGNDRVRKTASYLVPNIRDYQSSDDESIKSYAFTTNYDDYPTLAITDDPNRGILYNELGEYYPRDYFYRMTYNKVYTVSSFHNIFYNGTFFKNDRYVGIKEIVPTEEEDCSSTVLTPPVNFGKKNFTFSLLIADILLFFEQLINLVVLTFFNTIVKIFHALADAVDFWPIRKLSKIIRKFAYGIQDSTQRSLYLITYPECEECNSNEYGQEVGLGNSIPYCQVGIVSITGSSADDRTLQIARVNFDVPNNPPCSTTANRITNMDDLVARQSVYTLSYSYVNIILGGTGSTITTAGTGYTINDPNFNFGDPDTVYQVKIVDYFHTGSTTGNTVQVETGCELYDIPYDEGMIVNYYVGTGRTIVYPNAYLPTMDVVATNLSNGDYPLPKSYDGERYYPITPSGRTEFTNGMFQVIPGSITNGRLYEILKEYRRRKRVGVLFCGGIVNYSFIDNWLSGSLYFVLFKFKKGKYCDGIVKYIVNDTNGKSINKLYYKSARYHNESNWGNDITTNRKIVGRPTTMVDLGPRDEFIKEICVDKSLDPNCSVSRGIGTTSFQSFGEILGMDINYRLDTSNNTYDINNFFSNSGFPFTDKVFTGDMLQLISTNSEAGIDEFDLQNPKYLGYSYQLLDPDIYPNVFKQNGVWGPLPITFYFDVDGQRIRSCLNEPTHKDFFGNTVQGRLTESSQKVPFFLWDKKGTGFGAASNTQSWDYSIVQSQPLQGMTYQYAYHGQYDDSSDKYLLLPITYTFTGLTLNNLYSVTDVLEFDAVIDGNLYPNGYKTYNSEYPGFMVLVTYVYDLNGSPTNGFLYTRVGSAGNDGIVGWDKQVWTNNTDFFIRNTKDYYNGTKQILSTPFMFYFGLNVGKTGMDKFIERFGPKGAFTSAE